MGAAKKVGIGIAVVISILVIVVMVGSIVSVSMEQDKYAGLTEDEADNVKIAYERCEASAYLAGAGSDTATERALERCTDLENTLIERYKTN